MKMDLRALFSAVAILSFALTTSITVHAQSRNGIENRFAEVNGVKTSVSGRRKGGAGDPSTRLHPNQSHVAAADGRTCENPYGDRARPARFRRVFKAK